MYIEFDANLPVYAQIIDYFKRQIFGGHLEPGQKLPPVREVSQRLGVNPNTLQKAMAELERDGLVRAKRTAGRYVTTDVNLIMLHRQQLISELARRFLADISQLGCSYEEICTIIDSCVPLPHSQPTDTTSAGIIDFTPTGPYIPLVERYAEYSDPHQYQPQELYPQPDAYIPAEYIQEEPALQAAVPAGYQGADYLIDDDFDVSSIVLNK